MENKPLKPKFWKLSQGLASDFTFQDMLFSIDEKLVFVHKDTSAKGSSSISQAEHFATAAIGDYFYLTHGNEGIYLLGQFTGPVNYFSRLEDGWMDRPFRLISTAINQKPYSGISKWWTPNHNSTFVEVPFDEYDLFEELILKPYFDLDLSQFK
ncbi:hypothetical protein [Aggregatibacter kilianii]|uniref:hypothetical protein n=1 Tax=Aggregatibacter kilianii TaxID=2025884 RepID=UPI000D656BF3|nr:hypothetical protein [Aggregatibacter kilianii]